MSYLINPNNREDDFLETSPGRAITFSAGLPGRFQLFPLQLYQEIAFGAVGSVQAIAAQL